MSLGLPLNAWAKAGRRRRGGPTLRRMTRTHRLIVVLLLNLGLVAGLVAVGVTAHSIAVFAEGGDYLLDAAGVGVALLAVRLAARPASPARPAGYPNATSVAALINAGWLLVLELLVAAAALDRLATGRVPVDGLPVLVMSGIAALVMMGGAFVLGGDEGESALEREGGIDRVGSHFVQGITEVERQREESRDDALFPVVVAYAEGNEAKARILLERGKPSGEHFRSHYRICVEQEHVLALDETSSCV